MAKITYALPSNAVGKNIMYSPLTEPADLGGAYGDLLHAAMKEQLAHALGRGLISHVTLWNNGTRKFGYSKRGNQLRRCAASRRAGRPSYRQRQKQGRLARTRKRV